jgi:hypothetical protein
MFNITGFPLRSLRVIVEPFSELTLKSGAGNPGWGIDKTSPALDWAGVLVIHIQPAARVRIKAVKI